MDNLEELFAEASKLDIPFEENIIYQTIDDIKEYIDVLNVLKRLLENIKNISCLSSEEVLRNELVEFNKVLRCLKPNSYHIRENCRKIALNMGIKPEELYF